MSTKENVLAILAAILGVCLIGGGAYAIGLVVWVYIRFPDEPGKVLALIFLPIRSISSNWWRLTTAKVIKKTLKA
jgi:hypothetical protein